MSARDGGEVMLFEAFAGPSGGSLLLAENPYNAPTNLASSITPSKNLERNLKKVAAVNRESLPA